MAKLLGRVRRKMLSKGLPAVLDDLDDDGVLRAQAARSGPSPWADQYSGCRAPPQHGVR